MLATPRPTCRFLCQVANEDSYRDHLVEAGHTASRDYDRAIMALSGGALGVSLAFVRDLVPHPREVLWLMLAWGLFATSLLAILVSFLTSQAAIRVALDQYDRGKADRGEDDKSEAEHGEAGGVPGVMTIVLNALAAGAFVVGVICVLVFGWFNLKGVGR